MRRAKLPMSRPRGLHLIDLANLALARTPEETWVTLTAYRAAVPVGAGDHVVIAAPRAIALDAKRAWPEARVVVRRGPVDAALTGDFSPDRYRSLYGRVVIASGDGSLAPWASSLGIPVVVVSHQHRLSHRLMVAADVIVTLGSPPHCGGRRPPHGLTSPHPSRRRRGRPLRPRARVRSRAGVPC